MPLDGNFLHDAPPPNTELQPSFWENLETPSERPFPGGTQLHSSVLFPLHFLIHTLPQDRTWRLSMGGCLCFLDYRGLTLPEMFHPFLLNLQVAGGWAFLGCCLPTSLRQFCGFNRWWVCKCLVRSISLRSIAVCVCVCVCCSVVSDSLRSHGL